MPENFYLLPPEDLPARYDIGESAEKASVFLSSIAQPDTPIAFLQQAIDSLLANLKAEEIGISGTEDEQVCDRYFRVGRIHSQNIPKWQSLFASILIAKKSFLEATSSDAMVLSDGNEYWLKTHWTFISLIQALIICFLRFESHLLAKNFDEAAIELQTASSLMLSSGAAMEVTGLIGGDIFRRDVRPKMPDELSGVLMLDHNFLLSVWKRLHPYFGSLPEQLQHLHKEFVSSYKVLSISHKAVCDRFGGGDGGSLLLPQHTATATLGRFEINRLRMLHAQSDLKVEENLLESNSKQYVELGFETYANLLIRVFNDRDLGRTSDRLVGSHA